ncbi:MAG: glycosyltransferase [bacterium]|nr:glycosyltransferase [bacterium]
MTGKPTISVVVPSFQRPEALQSTVRQLKVQTVGEQMEVIVAGQQYPTDFALDSGVTFFNLPEASVTKAKNAAIRKARGSIILVLDDDLAFGPELVARHLAYYQDQTVAAVGGKVSEPESARKAGLFPAAFGHFNFFGEANTDSEEVKYPIVVEVTPGGNLSFRKEMWEKIGGYDENFSGNAVNEDNDFCLRIVRAGGHIICDPQISVCHQRLEGGTRGFGDVVDWYEQIFANHLYFFLKHFPKWRLPFFFVYRWRQELACLKYGRFSWRSWWAPMKGYWKGFKMFLHSRI